MSREHPSALMVYDEEAGKYAEAPVDVCMARWATGTYGHQEGEVCAETANRWIGDVPLCPHHYRRAMKAIRSDAIGRHRKTQMEIEAAIRENTRLQEQAEQLEAEKRSIVYYLYRPADDMIKIGTTTTWGSRFSTHRREHGDLLLLLAHAGGRKQEREMHVRFANLRPDASEWFQPGRPLLSWIRRQRTAQQYRETSLPEQYDLKQTRALLKRLDARYLTARLPVPLRVVRTITASDLTPPTLRGWPFPLATDGQHYCPAADAAEYLGLSVTELKLWHDSGRGPTYIQNGRWIGYKCSGLQPWAAACVPEQVPA